MNIYPSILERTTQDFTRQLQNVLPHFSHFQIDIADGVLVSNRTVQIEDIVRQGLGNELDLVDKTFEFHLMVQDWQLQLPKLEALSVRWNITRILIHLKAFTTTYDELSKEYEWGIVLNPEDDVSGQYDTISKFPVVQVMTIHPGAQGTPFVPETLQIIDFLREQGYPREILLDGAINDKTLPIILQRNHLPDTICPGSYFKEDVENRLKKLQEMLK